GAGGFVVPPATLPGNYRIRIRSYEASQTFGPCANLATGETEDYTLTVVADCAAKPNALYDGNRCDVGTVALGVEGTPGVTEFRFYDSLFGGTLVGTAPAVPGITTWTTPALASTTNYYVTAFNGVCESWYRQEITAIINPVANIVVTPSVPEVCGENNVVQIDAGGDFVIDYLVNEDFEGGGFGVLTRVTPNGNADTQWTNRTGPYVPAGAVWKPAITSKAIGNMFAVANSDFAAPNPKDTQLRTAALDASAFSDLFLSFRHYFSYYPGEPSQWAYVDVSTNGGGAWTTLRTYTSNQGYAMDFDEVTVDLSAYAGLPSVMVRFRYNLAGGSAWADGWAIDDIQVYGTRPLNTTFTWTGGTVAAFIDPACTIPYVAQTVTTVYVRPTAMQLASPSWSFTANATLGNGCPISEFITINNKTKLWKGTVDNNWYNANNWEPVGVPDANTCVFIYDGPFDSNINISGNDAFANTVTVRPSGLLEIQPNNDLTVTNTVTVDAGGTFNIENSGSLIQVNNLANTGNISMKRNVNLRRLDYVYWSSPVANYGLNSISTTTYRYKWIPTIGANTNGWGNWSLANETMVLGKGYIVRGPDNYSTTIQNYTQNFVGIPNNGIINMPISRGTYNGADYSTGVSTTLATRDDDNWNLIGNPYPSAINANTFLATNTNIAGFIKYWTHGTLPSAVISDPFYNN
ncbi:MAG: GEVED domain-containing protein, partial [Bacteroidia bacterium]